MKNRGQAENNFFTENSFLCVTKTQSEISGCYACAVSFKTDYTVLTESAAEAGTYYSIYYGSFGKAVYRKRASGIVAKLTAAVLASAMLLTALVGCDKPADSEKPTDSKKPSVSETVKTTDATTDSYITDEPTAAGSSVRDDTSIIPSDSVTTKEPTPTETPKVSETTAEPTPGTTEPTPTTTEPTQTTTEPTPITTEPTPITTEPTPITTEPTPPVTEPTPQTPEEIKAGFEKRLKDIQDYVKKTEYTWEGCDFNLIMTQLETLEADILASTAYTSEERKEIMVKILEKEIYSLGVLVECGTNILARKKFVQVSSTTKYLIGDNQWTTFYGKDFFNMKNDTSCGYNSDNGYVVTYSDGSSKYITENKYKIGNTDSTSRDRYMNTTALFLLNNKNVLVEDISFSEETGYMITARSAVGGQPLYETIKFDSSGKMVSTNYVSSAYVSAKEFVNITESEYATEFANIETVINNFANNNQNEN